jgi:sulfur-oxidizing protein SoxZ
MANTIKMRASLSGDVTTVKALMKHPMETGLRKDKKTGEAIPDHFIQEVVCEHNGKQVMLAEWGGSISQNPYISFMFKGAKAGDILKLSWTDNKGESDSAEEAIK